MDQSTNTAAGGYQGWAVAAAGSRIVVGAPTDDTGAVDSGVARVYSALTGGLVLSLTNPTPDLDARFGEAVSISGNRVIVGAPRSGAGGINAGSAYIFDLASATPTVPIVTILNPTPSPSDNFGAAVAISGSIAVVGAYQDGVDSSHIGAAYVYDLTNATSATPLFTLTNPGPASGENFGNAVAVWGSRVVVGARYDTTGAVGAGSAYVYDLSTANPTVPFMTLTNPTPVQGDAFGHSVAIREARVVVSAWFDDTGGPFAGSAYVYDLGGPLPFWPILTLHNPAPLASGRFGSSVAISGTYVAVGTYRDDVGATDAGTACVFDLSSPAPTVPMIMLTNPTPATNDRFGQAVAFDGTSIVVGTPQDDTLGTDRGAAYVYALRPALSLAPSAPGFGTLSWTPTNSPGFILQYTDSLAPTNWLNAPSGAANPVTVPSTGPARFYRLAQP